ncbi:MAG: hypothetical protein H0U66_13245 [Gemmatimonadaceae bacterium]|nr:hypothetical protein [Gemmatimonadaceae bacterium]
MAAFEIRPRRATELVDASFQLLRRFYPPLLTVSAIAMSPGVFMRIILREQLSNPTALMTNLGVTFGTLALSMFCIAIADAVLVVAASEGYLEGNVDLGRALGAGMRRLIPVILSVLLRYLVVFVPLVVLGGVAAVLMAGVAKATSAGPTGAIVLVVLLFPFLFWLMLYAGIRTFAVTPAVLLERQGPWSSITRSWRLSKDCTWHIFFSLGLAWLLYFVIALIATVVGAMLLSPQMVGVVSAILIIPIYPLLAVVTTLLYYDLRIRKEGFDLELMSKDLGAASPSASAPLPAA